MGFEIIGSRTDYEYNYGGYTRNNSEVDEIIATFDKKEDARKYIKKSRLKNPMDRRNPFKKKSLLAGYEFATIEEITVDNSPPHNPKI